MAFITDRISNSAIVKYYSLIAYIMGLLGAMVVGGATGALVGRHAARRQFEEMQAAQAQQEQLNQAQSLAAQAQQTAQAAMAKQQTASQVKKDPVQELQKLASLKQQGLLTEEEFQKLKMQLLLST